MTEKKAAAPAAPTPEQQMQHLQVQSIQLNSQKEALAGVIGGVQKQLDNINATLGVVGAQLQAMAPQDDAAAAN